MRAWLHRVVRFGFPAALVYFVLTIAVQVQNAVVAGGGVWPFAKLPAMQLENALVALLVCAVVGLLWRPWPLRVLGFAAASFAFALTVCDLVVYEVQGTHMTLALAEGARLPSASKLWDSFTAEAGVGLWWTLGAGLIALAWTFVPRVGERMRGFFDGMAARVSRYPAWSLAGLLAYAALSMVVAALYDPSSLSRHPLVSLAHSAIRDARAASRPPPVSAECTEPFDAGRLYFGKPKGTPDFAEVRRRARDRARPPNVVLIVLESVGARALLEEGLPRADVAPRLRQLATRSIVFDRIYNSFPGTVRGHLPIATGGRTITWGSLLAELESRYTGPTLVGELKARGYATALVSAQGLDFEGLGGFYRGQPFDALFEPDAFDRDEDDGPALEHRTEGRPLDAPSALVPQSERASVRAKRLNAWGIDERYALQVALDWIARVARPSATKRPAPFFLQFLTSATHHPYVSPPDVPRKRSETSRRDVYLDALSFSDSVVGELLDALGTRGLLEETILAVVGDHGQAFGDVHPRNLGHKSFLYEDNVRNFMLLSDARSIPAYQRSSQIASLGDVAPTLLRLAGHATAPSMPGRDLLARGYREGVRFFHKVAPPASWGLVDGSWKFVSPQIEGAGAPELYDLDADSDEQHNLAAAHPKRIALYACLCSVWYARTNDEFLDHLRGFAYRPTRRMRAEDVTTPGPKSLLFGLRAGDGRFTRRGRFHPLEEVVAFVEWLPLERDAHFEGAWVSPRGLVHKTPMHIDGSWSRSWHPFDGKTPLEPGEWRFEVRTRPAAPSARPIIASSFRVDPSVPLDAVRAESLRGLSIVARDASPERVRVGVTWGGGDPRTPQAALLEVEILGENARSFRADVLATEPPTHASLWPDPPLATGRYRVRVRSKGKTLAETAVRVSKPAVVSTTR